jgi:hypothetical protein
VDTISYDRTTEEAMFGVPADRNPRYVDYTTALDNHEPVPRKVEAARLVEFDTDSEVSGQPWYMRGTDRSAIPPGSIFLLDDGLTCRPYWGGSRGEGEPSPLYPEGREPIEILYPFPVNPEGKTRDDGRVIDYDSWCLGPRKAYHLKITREAVPYWPNPEDAAGAPRRYTREEFTARLRDAYGPRVTVIIAQVNGWLARGDGVAVYVNGDLGHPGLGQFQLASYGSLRALLEPFCEVCGGSLAKLDTDGWMHEQQPAAAHEPVYPPVRMPDTRTRINWRYGLAGTYRGDPLEES